MKRLKILRRRASRPFWTLTLSDDDATRRRALKSFWTLALPGLRRRRARQSFWTLTLPQQTKPEETIKQESTPSMAGFS